MGGDLLHMGLDVGMIGASILATPFAVASDDASMTSALMSMALTYFDDFIQVFKDKLIPALEDAVCMILSVSNLGQIVAKALQILCVIYNEAVVPLLEYTWCYLLMPPVMVILQLIQSLASLGGQVCPPEHGAYPKMCYRLTIESSRVPGTSWASSSTPWAGTCRPTHAGGTWRKLR